MLLLAAAILCSQQACAPQDRTGDRPARTARTDPGRVLPPPVLTIDGIMVLVQNEARPIDANGDGTPDFIKLAVSLFDARPPHRRVFGDGDLHIHLFDASPRRLPPAQPASAPAAPVPDRLVKTWLITKAMVQSEGLREVAAGVQYELILRLPQDFQPAGQGTYLRVEFRGRDGRIIYSQRKPIYFNNR